MYFCIGCFFLAIAVSLFDFSCNFEYLLLSNDIGMYEKSLDPEFCENILERIDLFNYDCKPPMEILDCG